MKKRVAVCLVLMLVFVSACNMPGKVSSSPTQPISVASMVAYTLTALGQSSVGTATLTPTLPTLPSPTDTLEPSITFTPSLTLPPSVTPTLTKTIASTATPIPKPGTIEGGISGYPYGSIPNLSIVAYGQEPPYNYSYWITASGDTSYSMTSNYLIPGKYQVVAYDTSGHAGGCPTIVTVKSEETSTCNISDWGGSYPPKPAGVP